MVERRFPDLAQAKADFKSEHLPDGSANKRIHAEEIKQFSQIVHNLANEAEPHPARKHLTS